MFATRVLWARRIGSRNVRIIPGQDKSIPPYKNLTGPYNAVMPTKETPPTTLEDIYSKLNCTQTYNSDIDEDKSYRWTNALGESGSFVDTTNTWQQQWALFDACLKSRDYERAERILINLARHPNTRRLYYAQGICMMLREFIRDDSTSLVTARQWIAKMNNTNAEFMQDPQVAAWMIKLIFSKRATEAQIEGINAQEAAHEAAFEAVKQFANYKLSNMDGHESDILQHMDVIGILNLREMVQVMPELEQSMPKEMRELFEHLAQSAEEIDLEDRNAEVESTKSAETSASAQAAAGEALERQAEPMEHTANAQNETSVAAASKQEVAEGQLIKESSARAEGANGKKPVVDLEHENVLIDTGIDELTPVTTWNLKAIRHSVLGLLNSNNEGALIKDFFRQADEAGLKLDTETAFKDLAEGHQIDFFSLKEQLPLEQQETFDDILDTISRERERMLETSTVDAARAKWEHEFESMKDKSMPSSVGFYMHNWTEQLIPLIKEEIATFKKADDYFRKNADVLTTKGRNKKNISKEEVQRYKEKMSYGPFLTLMKPETIATTVVLEVMKHSVTCDIERGAPVSNMVLGIARALELEYKSEQVLKSNKENSRYLKAMRKTPEFKRFLRSNKANDIVRNSELNNGLPTPGWDLTSMCTLGSALMSMLLQVAFIEVEGIDPRTKKTKKALSPTFYHSYSVMKGGKVGVIKINQKFVTKLGRDRLDNIQAQFLPMVCKPLPWTTYNDGGYLTKRLSVMRCKDDREQHLYAKEAAKQGRVDKVLEGLTNLGNTAWTVNKRILEVVTTVWNTGKEFLDVPPVEYELILPPPPPKGSSATEIFKHRRLCQETCNTWARNRSMRCDSNYKLEIARAFVGERIFFPNSIDFRGRAYPIPPHFNHLGNDMARSLLRFWTGKRLGEEGLKWLKIHLCNLMGYDKITLEARLKFTDDHIADIMDSANDPLGGKGWWKQGEKPWQALATMFELSEALKLEDPTQYISHQPIYQDGTCNGLQHYAALGGDIAGARVVNLIPAKAPSDIYTIVSKMVVDSVTKDAEKGIHEAIVTKDIISRKIVKQTVMTNVYGVTYVGARTQISKRLRDVENFEDAEIPACSAYLTTKVFAMIRELFDGAHAIQDWFALAAQRISKSIRLDSRLDDKKEQYKGMSSVIWTTPLGMPVVQPYRGHNKCSVQTNLQTLVIRDPFSILSVDSRKQTQGFAPNFVHSLDATHMLMSVDKCAEKGLSFASVHDSYWTHACDVPTMNKILREEFVNLHTKPLTRKLRSEFLKRYGDDVMIVNVDRDNAAYKAVKEFRQEASAKLGRHLRMTDELKLEKERRALLNSSDPEQRKLGKELKTSLSVLEDIGYDHTNESDKSGSLPILVPFCLPEVPQRGAFDVNAVKDSPYFFS